LDYKKKGRKAECFISLKCQRKIEGVEETLSLHRLGLFEELGRYIRRVAIGETAIKGYRFLPLPKDNLEKLNQDKNQSKAA